MAKIHLGADTGYSSDVTEIKFLRIFFYVSSSETSSAR